MTQDILGQVPDACVHNPRGCNGDGTNCVGAVKGLDLYTDLGINGETTMKIRIILLLAGVLTGTLPCLANEYQSRIPTTAESLSFKRYAARGEWKICTAIVAGGNVTCVVVEDLGSCTSGFVDNTCCFATREAACQALNGPAFSNCATKRC